MRKKSINAKKLIIITAVFIVLITGVIFVIKYEPGAVFSVQQLIRRSVSGEMPSELTEEIPVSQYSREQLLSDENITLNQSLLLINSAYPLEGDFQADILQYKDSEAHMNSCVITAYEKLKNAVSEKYDNSLYIMSAYRTEAEQLAAIENEGDTAAKLGESEHQAGLALDVYVKYYAGSGFINSEEGQFVNAEGWKYGFITRYPVYGESITGIGYEPWHIRYVGAPHAEIIYKNSITLEEYIDFFKMGSFYSYGNHIISRQNADSLSVPKNAVSVTLSPDNTGNIFITALMK